MRAIAGDKNKLTAEIQKTGGAASPLVNKPSTAGVPVGYQKTPNGIGVIPGGSLDPQVNPNSTAKAMSISTNQAPPAPAGSYQFSQAELDRFGRGIKFIKDPVTGAFVNPQGEYVDASGKKIDKPDPIATPQTTEQKAGSAIRGELGDLNQFSGELGLEKDLFPSDIQGMVDELTTQQKQKKEELQAQVTEANRSQDFQLSEAKRGVESQQAGYTAEFAQGREGAVSEGNQAIAPEANKILTARIDDAIARSDAAKIERANAMRDLEIAQKQGRRDAIQGYQDIINNAEQKIQQAETDALNAQTAASQELRATQESKATIAQNNLTTFQGLIEGGTELTPQALKGLSAQLDLPFETAFDYYEGAKAIREDKRLTNEEKQLANSKLNQELQDQIRGITTEKAKNLDLYMNLRKSGQYSQDEMFDFARALGVDLADDPFVQAELKIKQNEALIQQILAGNVGLREQLEIDKLSIDNQIAQTELNEMLGIEGGGIPNEAPITISVGTKQIQAQPVFATALQQADAEFFAATGKHIQINQHLRTSQQQQAIRDKFGYTSNDQPSGANGLPMAAPVGSSFHERGLSIDVSNWKEAAPYLSKYGIVNGLKGDMGHFSMGELNPQVFSGSGKALEKDLAVQLKGLAKNKTQAAEIEEDIPYFIQSGNKEGLKTYVTNLATQSLPADRRTELEQRANIVGRMEYVSKLMKEYEKEGGDLGIFQGTKTKVLNKINGLSSPKAQEIAQILLTNLEDFGRAQTGAAIQDFEKVNFQAILPNIYDGSELSDAKFKAFAKTLELDFENTVKRKIGDDLYKEVYGESATSAPQKSFAKTLQEQIYKSLPDDPEALLNSLDSMPDEAELDAYSSYWDS